MNRRVIARMVGRILCLEAVLMLPAIIVAAVYHEGRSAVSFGISIFLILAVGLPCALIKIEDRRFYAKEGFAAVGLTWLMLSAFGALPFFFSGVLPNYIDCFFETVSGFTTTGASVIANVEALPNSLIYWRSFTQWLGGMGVLVFILAFATLTTKNSGESLHLYRAESSGVKASKLVPRMNRNAKILYSIYIVLSAVLFIMLLFGRVSVFDALNITFTTAATGGFGIRLDSMESFSAYTQWVVAIGMFLFSINFNMFYLLLIKNFKRIFKSEELRVYIIIVLASILLITINIASSFETMSEAIRAATFQVTSIMSTTGYYSSDFDLWPQFSRTILFLLMFIGGCAGSTAGGAKVIRIMMVFKSAKKTVSKAINPNSVRLLYLDGERVANETEASVNGYMIVYTFILALGVLFVSLNGFDLVTTITSVVTCLNNVGPGLGLVGPTMNFGFFSYFSKIILSVIMLIGRLEIFPIMVLFSPDMFRRWRNRNSLKIIRENLGDKNGDI